MRRVIYADELIAALIAYLKDNDKARAGLKEPAFIRRLIEVINIIAVPESEELTQEEINMMIKKRIEDADKKREEEADGSTSNKRR